MPAACATSSTLTSANPRAVNNSMRDVGDVLRCRRAAPTYPRLRQHQTRPSIAALDAILCPERFIVVEYLKRGKFTWTSENQTDTELVTEILVEEVSIDGMCGVY